MRERPILFSAPMVRAILEGRKTQTRRVKFKCEPGDVLWVRESWNSLKLPIMEKPKYWYRADEDPERANPDNKWKPSIHMPRSACRLLLRVKAVREERLQDITDADAGAEGCAEDVLCNVITDFRNLWDSLNAKRGHGWDTNPLVTVIEFERIENYRGEGK